MSERMPTLSLPVALLDGVGFGGLEGTVLSLIHRVKFRGALGRQHEGWEQISVNIQLRGVPGAGWPFGVVSTFM